MSTLAAARPAGWRGTLGSIEEWRWAPLIPMAVAAVLGVATIGAKSLWLDEALSESIIRLPASDMLVYVGRNELEGSPYLLALQAWSTFGYGEAWLRLLSVVFGVVGVLATYQVGRRYGVGLPAALLLAVSPFFIHYEQEARVYTLLVAWTAITTLAYLRLVERPGRLRGAIYVVAAAVLIYVHPLSGWILVAQALATLLFVPQPWRWRLLALYVPVVVTSIPMVTFLAVNRGRASWIPPATPFQILHSLSQLMGAALLVISLILVIALGLGLHWRRELPILRLPLLQTAFTVGGILLMSWLVQPLFIDRYLIGVLPFGFIVVARAARSLPWPRVVMAGLIVISVAGVASWYIDGIKDDWRGAAAYIDAQAQPTDGVIIWPDYYRLPFAYYTSVGQPLYPSTPWSQLYLPSFGLHIDLPAEVGNERIWLVRNVTFNPPPEIAALLQRYDTTETRVFGPASPEVDLLVRRASP